MSDSDFVVGLLVGAVAVLILGSVFYDPAAYVRDERCKVHAEYAKTAADTAALVRRFPECAERYYRKEGK